MLLSPHLLAGMLGGSLAQSPVTAGFAGSVSYFLLEMVPHWNPENPQKKIVTIAKLLDILFSAVIVGFLLFIALSPNGILTINTSGIFMSATPVFNYKNIVGAVFAGFFYGVFFIADVFKTNIEAARFLSNLMTFIRYNDRSFWGIIIQVAICLLAIAILFNQLPINSFDKIQKSIL